MQALVLHHVLTRVGENPDAGKNEGRGPDHGRDMRKHGHVPLTARITIHQSDRDGRCEEGGDAKPLANLHKSPGGLAVCGKDKNQCTSPYHVHSPGDSKHPHGEPSPPPVEPLPSHGEHLPPRTHP